VSHEHPPYIGCDCDICQQARQRAVRRGFYRHYKKGGIYFVLGVSRNDDTGEELVIYESVQGTNDTPYRLRHRTVKEFTEEVDAPSPSEAGTYRTPRFERVEQW